MSGLLYKAANLAKKKKKARQKQATNAKNHSSFFPDMFSR